MVSGSSFQSTRDNLSLADTTRDLILIGVFNEDVRVEECPTIVKNRDLTGEGIWGIGFGNGTDSDGVWDEAGYVWEEIPFTATFTVQRVINPQNVFRERFRYDDFNDSTNSTTTFSTTYYNVAFTQGQYWQTNAIFKDVKPILSATIQITLKGGDTEFTVSDVDVEDTKTITLGQ